jgi:hypothetical protein
MTSVTFTRTYLHSCRVAELRELALAEGATPAFVASAIKADLVRRLSMSGSFTTKDISCPYCRIRVRSREDGSELLGEDEPDSGDEDGEYAEAHEHEHQTQCPIRQNITHLINDFRDAAGPVAANTGLDTLMAAVIDATDVMTDTQRHCLRHMLTKVIEHPRYVERCPYVTKARIVRVLVALEAHE